MITYYNVGHLLSISKDKRQQSEVPKKEQKSKDLDFREILEIEQNKLKGVSTP
jgi:hypothetical protein